MLLRHEGFRRLCLARDLLREIREPSPSIADIARDVRISPFHFIRQFEALFGVTPHQFRIQARLDAAKQLLASGRYSVTDVCLEVGFSSLGSVSESAEIRRVPAARASSTATTKSRQGRKHEEDVLIKSLFRVLRASFGLSWLHLF